MDGNLAVVAFYAVCLTVALLIISGLVEAAQALRGKG